MVENKDMQNWLELPCLNHKTPLNHDKIPFSPQRSKKNSWKWPCDPMKIPWNPIKIQFLRSDYPTSTSKSRTRPAVGISSAAAALVGKMLGANRRRRQGKPQGKRGEVVKSATSVGLVSFKDVFWIVEWVVDLICFGLNPKVFMFCKILMNA